MRGAALITIYSQQTSQITKCSKNDRIVTIHGAGGEEIQKKP